MRLDDVLNVLRGLAPEALAEPWDKAGLQVGDPAWPVRRAVLCIDLTLAVLAEAVKLRANLVVAYHPPIFEPLATVTTADWKGRVILEAIRRRIAIYSPHTALDAAAGGLNDWLTEGIGLKDVQAIQASHTSPVRQLKLVTFIPPKQADRLRAALSDAGAGRIGDYTHCSFNLRGEGTFHGSAKTNPTVGRRGRLERVEEVRMEMVVSPSDLPRVVLALRKHHPYEEPAFDVYPLAVEVAVVPGVGTAGPGQGRVGVLEKGVGDRELAGRVRKVLGLERVEVYGAKPQAARVRRVAVCAGAGVSVLRQAADADAWVTGEMRHHDLLDAVQRGKVVVLAGHTETERPYLPVYRRRIIDAGSKAVDWRISRADGFAAAVKRL